MSPRLLATVLALAAFMQQGGPVAPSIQGMVLDDRTGRPIPGVVITRRIPSTQPVVAGRAPEPQVIQTQTDAGGQFLIRNLDAGRVTIDYEHEGYYRTTLPFSLSPGDALEAIQVRLSPKGVVVGRVLDSSGKPLVQARVQPLSYRLWENRIQLASHPGTTTNDRGEYRLIDLLPGRYLLNLSPSSPSSGFMGGRGPAPPDLEKRQIGAALYPGTTTAAGATVIEVKPGQETRLRDVVLTSSRFGEVRVRVINNSPQPIEKVMVTLANSTPEFGPDGSISVYNGVVTHNDDRSPGAQGSTVVTFWPNALGVHTLAVAVAGENSIRSVDVDGRPKDLEIALPSPPADGRLSCRLILPGDSTASSNNVRVGLRSAANVPQACPATTLLVQVGTYQVTNVSGLAEDWYVAGIEQDSRDVLRNGAVVSQTDIPLNVRIASGAGSFAGKVIGFDGKPVQNALVALLPEGALKDLPLVNAFKSMRTDQRGMVSIRGIMPGEYVVYAWTGVEDNVHRIPAFVKEYEGRGKRLRIDANAKISENLTAIEN